jgi:diacylglycerol kinase (ATP)
VSRWLVAVNRAAGRRGAEPERVRHVLSSASVDHDMVVPASRQEMVEAIVEHAGRGGTHFAVVGGDGTVNLAINALMGLELDELPVVGILPSGTGCDLGRTFGLPQDMESAVRHLASKDTYTIDVAYLDGSWGRRYFVNVAQAGVGAAAAQTASRISRRVGAARYPLAFLTRLPRFPSAQFTLKTEKRTVEGHALAVIIANAQFFAGGWNVAPRATLIDGVVDVQIIDATKTRAPALVPKVVKGTHLGDVAVRRMSVSEFDLVTEPVWPVEADGDLIGNTDISGRVVPAAIKLKI